MKNINKSKMKKNDNGRIRKLKLNKENWKKYSVNIISDPIMTKPNKKDVKEINNKM